MELDTKRLNDFALFLVNSLSMFIIIVGITIYFMGGYFTTRLFLIYEIFLIIFYLITYIYRLLKFIDNGLIFIAGTEGFIFALKIMLIDTFAYGVLSVLIPFVIMKILYII